VTPGEKGEPGIGEAVVREVEGLDGGKMGGAQRDGGTPGGPEEGGLGFERERREVEGHGVSLREADGGRLVGDGGEHG